MSLRLPDGKRIAVNIGVDFDAHSLWMGTFGLTTPGYLSRGEFGAMVGAPRLLDLFRRHGIKSTWCTPTHTMETFSEAFARVMEAGHEIAAHGCVHEKIGGLDEAAERRLMERQIRLHEKLVGRRPRGYRSPSWDFTDHTQQILEDNGFDWDSSLMGRDFEPYRPRPVTLRDEGGNVFGPPGRILELPVSWFLDDFPALEYVPRANAGLGSTAVILERWTDHFDYAYRNVPQGTVILTVHPQTIGRAPNLMMLERFIEHVAAHDGVAFMTLSEICDAWSDDTTA
jgi:peptidoglycan/xylan/chitin deacetylase (PgdA/CDA1 family)